jgi:NADH-quinone oxidoreductase subunit J
MDPVFIICAVISLATAIGVIASRNPVYSAMFLVANLLTVAAMFAALNAHFLAVAQVIVYAGAIMVLFLFVIMLLNVKTEEPTSIYTLGFGVIAAAAFSVALLKSVGSFATTKVGAAAAGAPVVEGTVKEVGKLLYTNYIFPFEVASILIIAAIVGSVMLSQKVKRGDVGKAK